MKIFRIIYMLTLMTLLAGCHKGSDAIDDYNVDGDGVDGDSSSVDMTLTSLGASRSDGGEWLSRESIGVVMISFDGSSEGIDREFFVATASGSDVTFTTDSPMSYLDGGENDIVAYYPTSLDIEEEKSLGIDVRELEEEFLISASKSSSYLEPLTLSFEPLLSKIAFNIEATAGYDYTNLEGLSVSLSGLTPSAKYDLELAEFTLGEGEEFELQGATSSTTRSDITTDYSASIIPQSATDAYVNFAFSDGSSYSLSLDVATLSSGMVYTYSAEVSDSGVELRSLSITPWGDGGTQSGVASVIPSGYKAIYDLDDFKEYFLSDTYLSSNYILMADLSLGTMWAGSLGLNSGWVFDGNGHTITYEVSAINGANTYHALFVNNYGTIRNLNVAGDLAFTSDSPSKYFGGIAYENQSTGKIVNCMSSVDVSGTKLISAGGIATICYGEIINCCNLGDITFTNISWSGETRVGGITGYLTPSSSSYTASIKNCYNAGDISFDTKGTGYCGNVVALLDEDNLKSGHIDFDYLFCSAKYNDVAMIGNESEIDNIDLYTQGKTTLFIDDDKIQSLAFVEVLNNEAYTIAKDDGIENLRAWKLGDSGYPELDALLAPYYTDLPAGLGTEEYPYIISTEQQLIDLSSEVAAGDNKMGVYYALSNSIHLSSDWVPIGNDTTRFQGHFSSVDGNVECITLNISTYNVQYNGLFGVIGDSGYVHDIDISGSITANYYCGAVTGVNYGKVENCTNYATIYTEGAYAYVGGIIGLNCGSVTSCSNEGSISEKGYCVTIGTIIGLNMASREYITDLSSSVDPTISGQKTIYDSSEDYIIGTHDW